MHTCCTWKLLLRPSHQVQHLQGQGPQQRLLQPAAQHVRSHTVQSPKCWTLFSQSPYRQLHLAKVGFDASINLLIKRVHKLYTARLIHAAVLLRSPGSVHASGCITRAEEGDYEGELPLVGPSQWHSLPLPPQASTPANQCWDAAGLMPHEGGGGQGP